MKLDFYCTKWGFPDEPIALFCKRVKEAGYDGVEVTLPPDQRIVQHTANEIRAAGLGFIALRFTIPPATYEANLEEYKRHLRILADVQPDFINAHTGRDWYSREQNQVFLDEARAISEESGIRICHETHRGRFSFCAANTIQFIEDNPDIQLTADFSHWCNVSESLLEDQQHLVDRAIKHAAHIHCRVGHGEGPQVNDPRAPEWKTVLDAHMAWWKKIIECHRAKGSERLTLTPEFGPWPYMIEQPYTREPIADQWEINGFIKDYIKTTFASS